MPNTVKSILKKPPVASKRNDKLRQLAFDNTAQANIITTVSDGNILLANTAACKLLGYSKKELLTKDRSAIFNVKEAGFNKMFINKKAGGNSVATLTVFKKNAKALTCKITSAIFLDEVGNEKAITTIADMSKSILDQKKIDTKKDKIVAGDIVMAKSTQKKIDFEKEKVVAGNMARTKSKQKKIDIKKDKLVADNILLAQTKSNAILAKNDEWKTRISKASYDVMWDWDISTGKIYVGDSVKEVFGYDVKNNTIYFLDFTDKLLAREKNIVEKKIFKAIDSGSKSWSDFYMVTRNDGSIASTASRASIVRDDAGKAVRLIGAIKDVSKLENLEKKLEEQVIIHEEDSEKFLLAAKLSFDVIWDWNLLTNEVFLGDGFEELFGYKIKNNKGDMLLDWVNYLHPDDKEQVIAELVNTIKSAATRWEHTYRVSRADGSIAKVHVRACIVRHDDGKAYRMIGAMQDLSRQKELEEKLELETRLKEKQIAEATADAKETERSDIGKELHDNINQLLGASRMYMEMAKRGGGQSAMYLNKSSEYTITAIDEIRKLTKGLTTNIIKTLGLAEAIEDLCKDTMEVCTLKISCFLKSFQENSVDEKFKLNIFRIIQEQLNNILKHARATKVTISLLQNKKLIRLIIYDDGIGFDVHKKQKGIGIPNIKSRATAYNGSANFVSQSGEGCTLTASFPVAGLPLPALAH